MVSQPKSKTSMSQWKLPEASCKTFSPFVAVMLSGCGETASRLGMATNASTVETQKT